MKYGHFKIHYYIIIIETQLSGRRWMDGWMDIAKYECSHVTLPHCFYSNFY